MKKLIILSSILCLLITGCSSNSNSGTLNCTKIDYDDEGYKTTNTMVVNYKNDKVTTVTETIVSEMDSNYIDFTLSFGKTFAESLNEIEGLTAEYTKLDSNNLQYVMTVDYNKIDVDNVKEVLGDSFDENQESMYTNDVSLEKFKSDILNGYTCE